MITLARNVMPNWNGNSGIPPPPWLLALLLVLVELEVVDIHFRDVLSSLKAGRRVLARDPRALFPGRPQTAWTTKGFHPLFCVMYYSYILGVCCVLATTCMAPSCTRSHHRASCESRIAATSFIQPSPSGDFVFSLVHCLNPELLPVATGDSLRRLILRSTHKG